MSHLFRFCLVFTITCFAAEACSVAQVDFERDIKPIFENHCLACHSEDDPNGVRIDDKDEAMGYVFEGDADSSDLYGYLVEEDESLRMPPPDVGRPLNESQIMLVKAWINEGAVWPDQLESEWEEVPLPEADDEQLPYRAAGSLHPAVIHLPLGLLLAAGLFAFLSLRGNFVMSDCAYYCLWLGAIGAVVACATGWFFSENEGYGAVAEVADLLDQEKKMFWHRITGLGATAFAVILALFASSSRSRDPDDGFMWKLGVILLAAAIGYVGHEGGKLTYGEDHYNDLIKLYEKLVSQGSDALEGVTSGEVSEPDTESLGEGIEEGLELEVPQEENRIEVKPLST